MPGMGERNHRRTDQHIRRHGQFLRSTERRCDPLQTGQCPQSRFGEENQRKQNGIQMYGKYQCLHRGGQIDGRAKSRDIPERRLVGAPKPERRRHLPAVAGP